MSTRSLLVTALSACGLLAGSLAGADHASAGVGALPSKSQSDGDRNRAGKTRDGSRRGAKVRDRDRKALRARARARARRKARAHRRPGKPVVAPAAPGVDVTASTAPGGPAGAPLAPKTTLLPTPTPAAPPVPPGSRQPFAPSSFWNAPLADGAALDGRSAAYVAELRRQLTTVVPYVNTTRYSTPVYEVAADQPTVAVKFDNGQRDLEEAFARTPIPDGAVAAEGTDGHLVVWQRSTDTMWELWRARKLADGWRAAYGGRIDNVSANPGRFTSNPQWGATATSLPLLGGLMRLDELAAGEIPHALALALPELRAGAFSWPAQRTDGTIPGEGAIPAGTRFRIDPDLDLSTLPMAPVVRAMAVAAQRYGIVVRDRAGSVAFYAEDPTPTGSNPFLGPTGLFGGKYITNLLYQFPWAHLQALQTSMSYSPR